jgi:hypothetical protein
MKQFVYGALVATAVLGAAGFAVMKEPVAGAKGTGPLTLGQLTLDRAIRYTFICGPTSAPSVITAPSDQGFVFTYFGGKLTSTVTPGIQVSINGAPAEFMSVGSLFGVGFDEANNLNPPIILKPGESMAIGVENGTTSVQNPFPNPPTIVPNSGTITFGGYFVYPGEV